MVNMLSFDIEEYFHGPAFGHLPPSAWDDQPARLPDDLERLLAILGDSRATFFVLGWVARKHPELVRTLHRLGHEVACHGDLHRHLEGQSPRAFREDLRAAKHSLEDVMGAPVAGFRAPTFSMTRKTLWALDCLREAGFRYDSSIFPVHHDRYGIPDFPRRPFQILEGLWEIPLSTVRIGAVNLPFGGGGYFRLYPYWLTRYLVRRLHRENLALVFYQHTWELDHPQAGVLPKPRSVWARLRRSLHLGRPEAKLRKMLQDFPFVPMRDWLALAAG